MRPHPLRRRQKENQEVLLQRVNQATLDMLNKSGGSGGGGGGAGRKMSDIVAYKGVGDMQHNGSLTVQVDKRSECVLVPIYGMLVPFHILTVKNASNNQVGWGGVGGAARSARLLPAALLVLGWVAGGMPHQAQHGIGPGVCFCCRPPTPMEVFRRPSPEPLVLPACLPPGPPRCHPAGR